MTPLLDVGFKGAEDFAQGGHGIFSRRLWRARL